MTQTAIEPQQIEQAQGCTTALERRANNYRVTSELEYDYGKIALRECKAMRQRVEALTEPAVKSAHAAHKAAKAVEKALLTPIKQAEDIISSRMGVFYAQVKREREEEQRQIAAVEAEEREADRLERAAELQKAGRSDLAENVLSEKDDAPPPDIGDMTPKAEGLSVRTSWKVEVVAVSCLPRRYMMPDMAAIRRAVNAAKGDIDIRGVRIEEVHKPFVREAKGEK